MDLASGVAGLVSLALEVTTILQKYIHKVRHATEYVQHLAARIGMLSGALNELHSMLLHDVDARNLSLPSVCAFSVVEADCTQLLKKLSDALKKFVDGNRSRQYWEKAVWPFKQAECEGDAEKLRGWTETFQFCLVVSNW